MKVESLGSPAERGVTEERYLAERVARVMPLDLSPGTSYKYRQRVPPPWGMFAMDSLVCVIGVTEAPDGVLVDLGYITQDGRQIGGGGPGLSLSPEGVVLYSVLGEDKEQGYLVDALEQLDLEHNALLDSAQS